MREGMNLEKTNVNEQRRFCRSGKKNYYNYGKIMEPCYPRSNFVDRSHRCFAECRNNEVQISLSDIQIERKNKKESLRLKWK